MRVKAEELFVFAGAGVSRSMPASLPVFDELRDEVLKQLGLEQYMWHKGGNGASVASAPGRVAGGLAPELFMLGLSEAHIAVESWLAEVLSGLGKEPNAAHHALARLAAEGSRVWTVNFDTLTEQASGHTLRTVAWPAFPGYRGRDLDFQPIWDEVLSEAAGVIWFDVWADDQMNEAAFKRKLLAGVDARGKLELAAPAPLPPGAPAHPKHNPSWDFVSWLQDHRLVDIEPGIALRLFEEPSARERHYPPLPGDTVWARPAVQGMLGDYRGARTSYWHAARRPGYLWKAARGLGMSYVIHGGNAMASLLGAAVLLPPYGAIGKVRAEYSETLATVKALSRGGRAGETCYTRRSDFTAESITNDHAEFMRCGRHDLNEAWAMYEQTAASSHPLQKALGHLGLVLIQAERGQTPTRATTALRAAEGIGCGFSLPAPANSLRNRFPRRPCVKCISFNRRRVQINVNGAPR